MKNRNYYSNCTALNPSELGDFSFGVYRNLVQQNNSPTSTLTGRFDSLKRGYSRGSSTTSSSKRK